MVRCKICLSQSVLFARATVLNRHDVSYFRCESCGFVQTEEPYWLEEAYSEAIAGTDLGLVHRNLELAVLTRSVIRTCFNPAGKFLDYAGGYGLLVRLMRDDGFDFRLYDRYCENLFAQGFSESADPCRGYDLITAFEVMEHFSNPLQELGDLLGHVRNILFTTQILPEPQRLPGDWWYFGLDHGQHVSFFTIESLRILAQKLSLNFYTNGRSLHLFTERKISPLVFKLAVQYRIAALFGALFPRKSLLPTDYKTALKEGTDR